MRIAVTGATGFVGRAVCDALSMRGYQIVTIGRHARADIKWPAPGTGFEAEALALLSNTRAVVNLAGENIGARWSAARKRAIRASRVDNTRALALALASRATKPAVLISASASGYYGDRGDEWLDESSTPGEGFLSQLVVDWEAATHPASDAGIRVVNMRLGVVFGPGGIFGRVRVPFLVGGGARLGPGTQWMSWISHTDVVDFVMRALDDSAFSGPVNMSSPAPITNAEFTRLMAKVLGRPALFVAPPFALRMAFGGMADALLLASQRLRPARLLQNQFSFSHPDAEGALRAAAGR